MHQSVFHLDLVGKCCEGFEVLYESILSREFDVKGVDIFIIDMYPLCRLS